MTGAPSCGPGGRLRTLPEGLVLGSPARVGALLRSGLLSPAGAARMALDVAVPARRDGVEESIGAFFTRRLGREAYDRVVEPLLAGIHAGDATTLSLPALFPRFAAMEHDHGGLVRAALAGRRNHGGPPPTADGHSPFVSLQGGMAELIEALVAILSSTGATLQGGTRVTDLAPTDAGWRVGVVGGDPVEADAVIMATPAFVTAGLVRSLSPPATALLEGIPHASTATVSLGYRTGDVGGRRPAGYGFVVPRVEGRPLIAATWSSNKWPSRVIPGHHVIVRGYVGGVGREDVMNRPDEELVALVRSELAGPGRPRGRARPHRGPPVSAGDAAVHGRPPRAGGPHPRRAGLLARPGRDRGRLWRGRHPRLHHRRHGHRRRRRLVPRCPLTPPGQGPRDVGPPRANIAPTFGAGEPAEGGFTRTAAFATV